MHILYHQKSIHNSGGIERILLDKAGRLAADGFDVTIVTTDSPPEGIKSFFPIPEGVKIISLDINYDKDAGLTPARRLFSHFRKRRMHRHRLEALLHRLRPDVVITIYPTISFFIPDIKDGSKKIAELHFCRKFRRLAHRGGVAGLLDRLRDITDRRLLRRFDSVVTLTEGDKELWGKMENLTVIPNFVEIPEKCAIPGENRTVIAIGRLSHQKNFSLLLQAWSIVKKSSIADKWNLEIYGEGTERESLENQSDEAGISSSVRLLGNTIDIQERIPSGAIIAATSLYEGFHLGLAEGMAAGLPAVSTDTPCGPAELISNNESGILTSFDPREIANALLTLMESPELRNRMGKQGRKSIAKKYSPKDIMEKWERLFLFLTDKGK